MDLLDTDERKKGDEIQTHSALDVDFTGQKFAFLKTFRVRSAINRLKIRF